MSVKKESGAAKTVSKSAVQPEGGPGPVDKFHPSGAPAQVVGDVDPDHPAVDNDPRAGTTAEQNRIDFNDPSKSGAEAVADQLKAKG